jgi:hypothetical protein
MRTLVFCVLAVTLAGCSNGVPPGATADASGVAGTRRAAQPVHVSNRARTHARIADRHRRPSSAHPTSAPSKTASNPGPPASAKTSALGHQVEAATAVAERMMAPGVAASPDEPDPRVALIATRPEIKSISDLSGQKIAIGNRQAKSENRIRTAIGTAGATDVQLNKGEMKPVDRLLSGEVPAAVLTLLSAEAAASFPDIAGYRIFRMPLSPRPVDANQKKP